MDHAKNLYLRDLQELEATGFIRKGTHVAADNVVFNRLDQYRDHCKALQTRKIVVTRLEKMNLEYTDSSQNVEDGIGESILSNCYCCLFLYKWWFPRIGDFKIMFNVTFDPR